MAHAHVWITEMHGVREWRRWVRRNWLVSFSSNTSSIGEIHIRPEDAKPGLYRAQAHSLGNFAYSVHLGKRVDLAEEIQHVKEMSSRNGSASTGAPGIAGYQQATDAATEAMKTRKSVAKKLLFVLRDLSVEVYSHAPTLKVVVHRGVRIERTVTTVGSEIWRVRKPMPDTGMETSTGTSPVFPNEERAKGYVEGLMACGAIRSDEARRQKGRKSGR